jgi:acyl-CoA synthetase (AMP-forming)/AMP-acid ligase II
VAILPTSFKLQAPRESPRELKSFAARWSTAWKVETGAKVSIGRPLANTQLYILDGQHQPVPVGVSGDLYIGGEGLARGYRGREDLTAEKFIANPFVNDVHARIYKTGDCARYLPDGTVECLGRVDHQVKIRSFRIELGDVETALRSHNKIAHAVVVARKDGAGGKRLVGYVKSRNAPLSHGEMREFVRAKVPAYMVPANFVMVDEFPSTPNGKIDVRRLPAPDGSSAKAHGCIPFRTDDERALVEVWQKVLGVSRIGINDDVFDGGSGFPERHAGFRAHQSPSGRESSVAIHF